MTNSEATGYVIMAMKNLNYTKEQIKEVEKELKYVFDMKSENEAETVYMSF